MAFFSLMALKATQGDTPYKYLSVITNDIETQGYLEYSADEFVNPNAKFAVENAHNGLVHIRSCRTNKYWVRSSTDGYWIVAKASEPLDDETAWNSTLFRMDLVSDNDNKAKFYHVQSGTVLRIPNDSSDRKMLLCIDPHTTTEAISTAVDLETIPILPKYIALQADNGKFFDYSTMGFTSDDYAKDTVVNEILITRDGYIKIYRKGTPEGYLWYCLNTLFGGISVVIDSHREVDLPEVLFEVVRVKDGVVAVRSMGNGKFCRRGVGPDAPPGGKPNTLTVFSRRVQVLDFDLDNSRIYNMNPISSDTHTFDNPTNEEQEASMNLAISTTKTTTWNNSFTATAGVETSFTTGIPFIAEGEITVSVEASYQHDFGGTLEEAQEVGDTYTVKVPPMKRVTGRGVATQGTCDVPFTYTQVDHLTDGSTIRTTLSDGVFTGVNAYNFYHDVHYEDIPDKVLLELSQHTTSTH